MIALGLLKGIDWLKTVGAVGILVGMGHSILAVSGEETLAQVYREIEARSSPTSLRTGMIIFLFALFFTGFNSLFASMIVPQRELIGEYKRQCLSGLAMHLVGSRAFLLGLQAFVVVVGFLILAGAVNTALIGSRTAFSTGLLRTGCCTIGSADRMRSMEPPIEFLHTLAILQLFIIIVSRGDVFLLARPMPLVVVWSFVMKAYSMIILRYKMKNVVNGGSRFNVTIGKVEIPIGLGSVFTVLFLLGIVNLFTNRMPRWGASVSPSFSTLLRVLRTREQEAGGCAEPRAGAIQCERPGPPYRRGDRLQASAQEVWLPPAPPTVSISSRNALRKTIRRRRTSIVMHARSSPTRRGLPSRIPSAGAAELFRR